MIAVILALASSVVLGTSDFLGGLMNRSVALLTVLVVSQGTGLLLLTAIVLAGAGGPPAVAFVLFAVICGLCECVGIAALYRGLAVGAMSVVAPVAATVPVVPVVVGISLGESPAQLQAAGIALAVMGIVLTSWGRSPAGAAVAGLGPSVLFGLLAALGHGGFYTAMDAASEGGVVWALFVARLTSVAVFACAMLLGRVPVSVRDARLLVIGLIGVLIVCGDSLYATSSTLGALSVVAVLSSLYPLVTIGLARAYLRERIERLQWIGIAACLIGVIGISVG